MGDGLCTSCGNPAPVYPRCEGCGEVDDDPHGTGQCVAEPCDECGGDPEALDANGLCANCVTRRPVILGLLHCTWAHEPARVADWLARKPEQRHKIIATLLAQSVSGKRLLAALGSAWFNRIVWDNVTPVIAASANEKLPADLEHVRWLLDTVKPTVVVTFGSVAHVAMAAMGTLMPGVEWRGQWIEGPHPAAKYPNIAERLAEVRAGLDKMTAESGDG